MPSILLTAEAVKNADLRNLNLLGGSTAFASARPIRERGDKEKAKEFSVKATDFNSLPQINYAFIRAKAMRIRAGVALHAESESGKTVQWAKRTRPPCKSPAERW